MARQERNDVDYFPHKIKHGKKMFILESKYKNDGYSTWFKILEELGKTDYHYLELKKEETVLYLCARCFISEEILFDIINILVKFGDIDKELWENHKIVWNQEFRDSIQDAYRKRSNECIDKGKVFSLLGLGKHKTVGESVITPPESSIKAEDKQQDSKSGVKTAEFSNKEKKRKEKGNKMFGISENEIPNTPPYLKIAFNFWKLFRKITLEANSKTTILDKANASDWETQVRIMLQKKEVTEDELRKIYIWLDKRKTKNAQFWAKNIKSTAKLREQIPKILEQMNSEKPDESEQSHVYKKDQVETKYPGVLKDNTRQKNIKSISELTKK